ncbi:uncharacterized protein LOC113861017 [Abrus precatorius]|uniref:Uncharacterized protein LOC113861017 n=1 Tax=Abrus precatorius TaxID=3816 RepID=A0A8B8L415_ABRPR|nr:uncharacterized protein LOC113861017 [Abrus precatorius]
MEQTLESTIIINNNIPSNTNALHDDGQHKHETRKRKKGAMHVLRVALFILRGRSRKSKVLQVNDESKSIWKKLVGSMRPLHLQSDQSSSSFSQPTITLPSTGSDGYVSDIPASEEEPYSPSPTSSRYASAVGLNELVQGDEENEKKEVIVEECEEHDDGDEMIDAKAEEFITHFYEQIRLQRLESLDRRYIEWNQRSLG